MKASLRATFSSCKAVRNMIGHDCKEVQSSTGYSLSYSISGSWRFGNILESLKRHMLSHDRLLQMELSVQWNSRPIVSLVQLGKSLLFWTVNVSVIFSTFLFKALLLLLFSCQIMSDSLRPHGLQHARPPCPSPSPRVCPSSCPLNQWCHPATSSSVVH